MNKQVSGKNSQIILVVLLAIALLFAFYYYLVLPKKDEVSSIKSSINSLSTEVATAKQQTTLLKNAEKPKATDFYTLRKKVPQTRAVDQLLLNIEQMEFVVGARVESISFNNYDSLVSSSPLQDPNQVATEGEENTEGSINSQNTTNNEDATNAQNATNTSGNADATTQTATPISTISPDQLPAELKMLTLNINVQTPDYESLMKFILEVETLERVVRVDTISYSLPTEQERLSPDFTEVVNATIQVTTFYYEGDI